MVDATSTFGMVKESNYVFLEVAMFWTIFFAVLLAALVLWLIKIVPDIWSTIFPKNYSGDKTSGS